MILDDFAQEAGLRADEWALDGIAWEFRPPSSDEQGRDKWAAVLVLDSPLAGGDLVVWTSGEAEPQVVYEDGRARLTHYDDLRARDDLRSAIAEVALLVTHRPQEHTLIDLIRP